LPHETTNWVLALSQKNQDQTREDQSNDGVHFYREFEKDGTESGKKTNDEPKVNSPAVDLRARDVSGDCISHGGQTK
jgi:hypothetical protein